MKVFILSVIFLIAMMKAKSQNRSAQKSATTTSASKQNSADNKGVFINQPPPCNADLYIPLCTDMSYTYNETNLLGINYQLTVNYKYRSTFKKDGILYYGYTVSGEQQGTDGNIYYTYNNGVITQYYEIPSISQEYAGSEEEVIDITKIPEWPGNSRTIDYYNTNIKYNTGNFRAIRLLKFNDSVGSTWTDKTIVDNFPAEVTHTIISKLSSLADDNGNEYKDVIILLRKTVTNPATVPITSLQYITYAKGIGIISIRDIDRKHIMSDFVKPNRSLSFFKTEKNQKAIGDFSKAAETVTPQATVTYELGKSAMASMYSYWCGTWKLIDDNGRTPAPDEITEYVQIETEGDMSFAKLQRRANGKLYLMSKFIPKEWSVWAEQSGNVIYFREVNSKEKGTPIQKKTGNKKMMMIGNKTYEYVARDLSFIETK